MKLHSQKHATEKNSLITGCTREFLDMGNENVKKSSEELVTLPNPYGQRIFAGEMYRYFHGA